MSIADTVQMASPEAGTTSVAQLLQSWTLGAFLREHKAKAGSL